MKLTAVLFCLTVLALGAAFLRSRIRATRLSHLSWEGLIARLQPVASAEIALIAADYLQPHTGKLLDSAGLWHRIGELEGLLRMYENSQVLIALAGYAQRWNRLESLVVMEQMRRDGITLRRATLRLNLGLAFGYDRVRGPFIVQEAASAYYLMRARTLALYETAHAGRLPQLVSAL